jgi:hypothetical protein
MPLFVVDTITMHRMRYVVEAKELDHALDEVTMRDSGYHKHHFEEFSQKYLGETIIDSKQINKDEYAQMLVRAEHDTKELSSYWLGDKLIRVIDYGNQREKDQKGS